MLLYTQCNKDLRVKIEKKNLKTKVEVEDNCSQKISLCTINSKWIHYWEKFSNSEKFLVDQWPHKHFDIYTVTQVLWLSDTSTSSTTFVSTAKNSIGWWAWQRFWRSSEVGHPWTSTWPARTITTSSKVPKTDGAPGRTQLPLLGRHLHTLRSALTTLRQLLVIQEQDIGMRTVFYTRNFVLKNYPQSINRPGEHHGLSSSDWSSQLQQNSNWQPVSRNSYWKWSAISDYSIDTCLDALFNWFFTIPVKILHKLREGISVTRPNQSIEYIKMKSIVP
jgi:hypothetical protein